jgi:hypothetical protein
MSPRAGVNVMENIQINTPNKIQTLDHPAHSVFTIPPMLPGSRSHLITERAEKHYFMKTCITVHLDHFTGW